MHDAAPADGGVPPAKRGPGVLAAADCDAAAPTVPTLAPIGSASAALPPLSAPGVQSPAGMNGMAGLVNGHASVPGALRPLATLPGSFPPIGHSPTGAAASLPPLSHAAANGSATVASTAGGAAAASPSVAGASAQLVAAAGAASSPPPDAPPGGSRKRKHMSADERTSTIARSVRTILDCIDDDPARDGLIKTPERFAAALQFFTSGYTQADPSTLVGDAEWDENHSELVLVRDISIFSLCEHHLVPFHGKVHIAYIPNGKIVGLSKLARLATLYARRLQVQERLTTQIADAVANILNPLGVAVLVEATHMCMVMRGVQKVGASTVTHCMRGVFRTDPALRKEFINLATR